jgi:REP element-mobilizing transposase RayT
MARANRHHIPGQVWHITHRCHKKEFLLKFARDRRRWYSWLFEAKKRFGLIILNYVVTSNHIHLMVVDSCLVSRQWGERLKSKMPIAVFCERNLSLTLPFLAMKMGL